MRPEPKVLMARTRYSGMTTATIPKLIEWNAKYSVGISSIDTQHQKLIGFINDLHAAMASGKASSVVEKTLDGLVAYTISHFGYEEGLMRTHRYPELDEHKAEHVKLVGTVKRLQQDLRDGKIAISLELMRFLKNWLVEHIAGVDKKYTAHLVAAGLK